MGTLRTTTVAELPNHPPSIQLSLQNFTSSQKTILNLLNTKCTNSLKTLQQAHSLILTTGLIQDHYVAGSLLKCYSNPQFGSLSTLSRVLQQIPEPNVFVWNSLIRGCLDLKHPFAAISMYYKMMVSGSSPNKFTYPQLFKACTVERAIEEGLQIHSHVVKLGLIADGHVISAGIQMYASLGRLMEARNMLELIGGSDIICCNAMIDGYMKSGDMKSAVELFEIMEENKNVSSWNTMISGFFSNGMVTEAEIYFNRMPEKDEVSWSAMIDGCNKCGCFKEAMEFFNQMQREGMNPSKFVLSSALASCANLAALEQGKWIHTYIKKRRILVDSVLAAALVDMYAKCGRLDMAWDVFENTKDKQVFCWNAMIGGLSIHGRGEDAIELFLKMTNNGDSKVRPNGITFVALLNACAHAGFVHQGLKFFVEMKPNYNVEPEMEHYGCVVNLLAKAGYFNEAENLINSMPMKPKGAVYGALLGACRVHGNVDLAQKVGEILLNMEEDNSGRYTLLSNIYAKAGKWEKAEEVRALMKQRGVQTITGRSTIEVEGVVHEFKVGDPRREEIGAMVEKMMEEVEAKGHEPDTSQVLFDVSEEEKETSLKYHSEKLAIAFGILNTKRGETIRVVKNLRVCEDCHSATKIISKLYDREIILRDRIRYHHFRNGKCSCKDFW